MAKEEVKRYMAEIKAELVKDIQANVYDKEKRLMNEWGAQRLAALSETTEQMKKLAVKTVKEVVDTELVNMRAELTEVMDKNKKMSVEIEGKRTVFELEQQAK